MKCRKDHVLGPLGLHGSFYVSPDIEEKLLKLSFRKADGGLEPWAEQTTKLPERDPAKSISKAVSCQEAF